VEAQVPLIGILACVFVFAFVSVLVRYNGRFEEWPPVYLLVSVGVVWVWLVYSLIAGILNA